MRIVDFELVATCLKEFSDINIQKRLWLSTGSSDISSFTEAFEQMFTDSGLGDALDKGTVVFSPEIDKKLLALEKSLLKIDTNRPPACVISDLEMLSIRKLAADILSDVFLLNS